MVHWLRLRSASNTVDYGSRYLQTRGFKARGPLCTLEFSLATACDTLCTVTSPVPHRSLFVLQDETKAGKRLQCSVKDAPIPAPILRGLMSKVMNGPDSPYWILQNHNMASNGLRFHRGRLLATYETGESIRRAACSAFQLVNCSALRRLPRRPCCALLSRFSVAGSSVVGQGLPTRSVWGKTSTSSGRATSTARGGRSTHGRRISLRTRRRGASPVQLGPSVHGRTCRRATEWQCLCI